MAKPIVIDFFTEKCAKCGFYVKKGYWNGGDSQLYESWDVEKFDYCPHCGEKVERDA